MDQSIQRPILVTGSHRSGSTWVGRIIALSSSVVYIQEPFNPIHRKDICKAQFDYWFTYVCKENERTYYDDIKSCLNFKYHFDEGIKMSRSARDFSRTARDWLFFSIYRQLRRRPLMKDPIAVLSSDWLARTYNMDVIVMIRHPAAFAGSLKSANWHHPFDHFLLQPLLMRDHLEVFRGKIEEYAKSSRDIVDQAILLWNIIHYVILKYMERNPAWIIVRHEDLSGDPERGFGEIFEKLKLPYTPRIRKKIQDYSSGNGAGKSIDSKIIRKSQENIRYWENRLTDVEIERVKQKTFDIASKLYSAQDW